MLNQKLQQGIKTDGVNITKTGSTGGMNDETETKYPLKDLAQLEQVRMGVLGLGNDGFKVEEDEPRARVWKYLDTPDHDFVEKGISFSVRDRGKDRFVTIKFPNADKSSRTEFEFTMGDQKKLEEINPEEITNTIISVANGILKVDRFDQSHAVKLLQAFEKESIDLKSISYSVVYESSSNRMNVDKRADYPEGSVEIAIDRFTPVWSRTTGEISKDKRVTIYETEIETKIDKKKLKELSKEDAGKLKTKMNTQGDAIRAEVLRSLPKDQNGNELKPAGENEANKYRRAINQTNSLNASPQISEELKNQILYVIHNNFQLYAVDDGNRSFYEKNGIFYVLHYEYLNEVDNHLSSWKIIITEINPFKESMKELDALQFVGDLPNRPWFPDDTKKMEEFGKKWRFFKSDKKEIEEVDGKNVKVGEGKVTSKEFNKESLSSEQGIKKLLQPLNEDLMDIARGIEIVKTVRKFNIPNEIQNELSEKLRENTNLSWPGDSNTFISNLLILVPLNPNLLKDYDSVIKELLLKKDRSAIKAFKEFGLIENYKIYLMESLLHMANEKRGILEKALIEEGVTTKEEIEEVRKKLILELENEFLKSTESALKLVSALSPHELRGDIELNEHNPSSVYDSGMSIVSDFIFKDGFLYFAKKNEHWADVDDSADNYSWDRYSVVKLNPLSGDHEVVTEPSDNRRGYTRYLDEIVDGKIILSRLVWGKYIKEIENEKERIALIKQKKRAEEMDIERKEFRRKYEEREKLKGDKSSLV